MIYPIIGLIAGLILGLVSPMYIPYEYSQYMSVALMAGLDSAFGGVRSGLEKKFDNTIFITGFFTNTLLAVLITFIGEKLSINLYFVATLTFGFRMFQNIAIIRRLLLKK